jgi:uncharacterized membrane-anchored protein
MTGKTGCFILAGVCLLQAAAPLSMILSRELTLRTGAVYRFESQPVDPYDAFRGKFVRLGFGTTRLPTPVGFADWPDDAQRRPLYVTLGTNDQGFAVLTAASPERPVEGDYLGIKRWHRNGTNLSVTLPMDRYYMNEQLAPEAERAYRTFARDGEREAYAVVRVRRGRVVIESLNVGELPIEEFVTTPPVLTPED